MTFAIALLGVVPSLIWLLFYLREDYEPEPKSFLAKVFLMGIIISPLAIIFQLSITNLASKFLGLQIQLNTPSFFFWAALVEEVIKFYAVKIIVLDNPVFDEPTDAMIYMITAALGFATMENILVMNKIIPSGISAAVGTLFLRFFGATLLHALASGLMGYFLAVAWFYDRHRKKLIFFGLGIATCIHFAFNILLSNSENHFAGLGLSSILLLSMTFLLFVLFSKIRKRYCRASSLA